MKNKETVETGRKYVLQLLYLRSEEHTSELQSQSNLVCRLLLEKKKDWRLRVGWGCTLPYMLAYSLQLPPPAAPLFGPGAQHFHYSLGRISAPRVTATPSLPRRP